MNSKILICLSFLLGINAFASGRALTLEEKKSIMPLVCNHIKSGYENSRYQVNLNKCVSSKIYIKQKDPNYGTYVYGDFKVDDFSKINCSIQLTDDLKKVILADCSDE